MFFFCVDCIVICFNGSDWEIEVFVVIEEVFEVGVVAFVSVGWVFDNMFGDEGVGEFVEIIVSLVVLLGCGINSWSGIWDMIINDDVCVVVKGFCDVEVIKVVFMRWWMIRNSFRYSLFYCKVVCFCMLRLIYWVVVGVKFYLFSFLLLLMLMNFLFCFCNLGIKFDILLFLIYVILRVSFCLVIFFMISFFIFVVLFVLVLMVSFMLFCWRYGREGLMVLMKEGLKRGVFVLLCLLRILLVWLIVMVYFDMWFMKLFVSIKLYRVMCVVWGMIVGVEDLLFMIKLILLYLVRLWYDCWWFEKLLEVLVIWIVFFCEGILCVMGCWGRSLVLWCELIGILVFIFDNSI